MNVIDVLFIAVAALGVLIFLSIFISLVIFVRIKRLTILSHEVREVENNLKKRIEQYVAKVARDELAKLIEQYRGSLDEQNKELIYEMKKTTNSQAEAMKGYIKQQEGLITKQADYIIGAVVKKAQDEIEDYKKAQFERVDSEVEAIVGRVSREVLGKAILLSEHEELVWSSLERAKKEGIFSEMMNREEVSKAKKTKNKK